MMKKEALLGFLPICHSFCHTSILHVYLNGNFDEDVLHEFNDNIVWVLVNFFFKWSSLGFSKILVVNLINRECLSKKKSSRYEKGFSVTVSDPTKIAIFSLPWQQLPIWIFMPPAWKVRRGHLVFGSSVRLSVCPSLRLSVRNSVPLINKVQYLKFGWSYSHQTWTVSSSKGCSHFTDIGCPWG